MKQNRWSMLIGLCSYTDRQQYSIDKAAVLPCLLRLSAVGSKCGYTTSRAARAGHLQQAKTDSPTSDSLLIDAPIK